MKKKTLLLAAIAVWAHFMAAPPRAESGQPYCGDGNCNSWSCAGHPGQPGNGCEEDNCSCPQDCEEQTCFPCEQNWVTTYTRIGYAQEEFWSGYPEDDLWCTYGELYHVNEHETNGCALPDRDYCAYFPLAEEHHIPFSGYCCWAYACSGYQYCPY